MTLDRGSDAPRSKFWLAWGARAGLVALLFSCVSPPPRGRARDAGGDETGGSGQGGSGGRAGSGGRGGRGGAPQSGGAGGDETGGEGGSGGSGGTGGKADAGTPARLDAGPPPPDAQAKLDGKRDVGAANAQAWERLNLVLANCVFCHNDPTKRLDLQESGLHERLVNKDAERVPANCANKVLVVPNDPMASLLYQKLTGNIPANCGERMPYKKPAVTQLELDWVADWIKAGAPPAP